MGLRHGGNIEAGDAGLTDAQIRALSGHKTTACALYTKVTMKQLRSGATKKVGRENEKGRFVGMSR